MNLTEKELSVLNELLSLEENIWKKYQMYCEKNMNCDIINEGMKIHKENLQKLYAYLY